MGRMPMLREVRGDLDWIVMKSLEKDRARRYDNVSTLGMDVQRHLADEPVTARAPSTTYRLHKLLRRHRAWAVRTLVLALLASTLAIVVSLWNENRVRLMEAEATEHRRALTKASGQFARAEHGVALETLKPVLESRHVGTDARLLRDQILNDARDKVRYYTRKITADPKDAESYLRRAQQYDYLRDEGKVYADMGQYATILGQEWFSGVRFGSPANLGPAVNSVVWDSGARLSQDGLSLYFERADNWNDPMTAAVTIWIATRATKRDPWQAAVSLGMPGDPGSIYKSVRVIPSKTTADGLEMYRTNPSYDLVMMKRERIDADWGPVVNLGPVVNSSAVETCPAISPDGLELYFSIHRADGKNVRPGACGGADLWVTKRTTRNDPWGEPVNLGQMVNSASHDGRPYISPDGLLLFFDSDRPSGYGNGDLYVTRRASLSDPWGTPVNLGPIVNTSAWEEFAYMSADGSTLYWDCARPGGYGSNDIWQVPIVGLGSDPDLNGRTAEPHNGGDAGKEAQY
jgi:hypothetical protein